MCWVQTFIARTSTLSCNTEGRTFLNTLKSFARKFFTNHSGNISIKSTQIIGYIQKFAGSTTKVKPIHIVNPKYLPKIYIQSSHTFVFVYNRVFGNLIPPSLYYCYSFDLQTFYYVLRQNPNAWILPRHIVLTVHGFGQPYPICLFSHSRTATVQFRFLLTESILRPLSSRGNVGSDRNAASQDARLTRILYSPLKYCNNPLLVHCCFHSNQPMGW